MSAKGKKVVLIIAHENFRDEEVECVRGLAGFDGDTGPLGVYGDYSTHYKGGRQWLQATWGGRRRLCFSHG